MTEDVFNAHAAIWFDVETAGLDPHTGHLLEWAAVLAADAADGDLTPIHEFTAVIHADIDPASLDPKVRDMHTRNGLLADCAKSTATLDESDAFLYTLCESLMPAGQKPRGIWLAGNSVSFDLGWVRVHLPRFASCLHYRVFDVTSLQRAAELWLPGYVVQRPDGHRALEDVRASLRAASYWRQAVGL